MTCVVFDVFVDSVILTVKHTGNLSLDQMIEIARVMRPRSQARQLAGTVKEVLGTAQVRHHQAPAMHN